MSVKLVAAVKLLPEDDASLRATAASMNAAAQWAADVAYQERRFRRAGLQKRCYQTVRTRFGLGAQAAIHAVRKAADGYADKARRDRPCRIDPGGAVTFDDRNLAWNVDASEVRVWTVTGRLRVPFVCGARQRNLLDSRQGESDLVWRDGSWYLIATVELPEPEPVEVAGMIGVDVGQKYLAATSTGRLLGREVAPVRARYFRLRRKLQANGSKSAKRLLRKRRRRESRFVRDVNHQISKSIVGEAERTGSGIAIENLEGIRHRVTVRRHQRRATHQWSYDQLRRFLEYKARRAGVQVVVVDPAYTSRRCPMCHHTSRKNRPSRDVFRCRVCGLAGPADVIAAANIAFLGWCEVGCRAAVMRPNAGTGPGQHASAAHGACRATGPERDQTHRPGRPPASPRL